MKARVLRVVAAGALTGLIATATPLVAQAATVPTWDPTTDAPVWVLDGETLAEYTDKQIELPWNYSSGVYLGSVPAEVFDGDSTPYQLAKPTAEADHWRSFIAEPGKERTRSEWGAWGDPIPFMDGEGGVRNGPELPQITPVYQSFGKPANIKSAGGTYSLGVAYVDQLDKQVIAAYYVTINVDAGTGLWKFSTPTAPEPTRTPTTTTLAASATSVEVGQTIDLTATVAPADVAGSVEFYKGSTKLGTQVVAAGTATLLNQAVTEGANKFSAKFLPDDAATYAGSTSTVVAVNATKIAGDVPDAPHPEALTDSNKGGATATIDQNTVTLNVDPALNGTQVRVFGYSTPTYLGQLTVIDGKLTVDVSVLGAGAHQIAITDQQGSVLAWASFDKTAAAVNPSFAKPINADVAASTTPADGEFSLTDLTGGASAELKNPTLTADGQSLSSGTLGAFKVTDLRAVSQKGWTLNTTVDQFVLGNNEDTIDNSALGIEAKTTAQTGGNGVPTLGAKQDAGSASYAWTFAELAANKYSGETTFDADLEFLAPKGKKPGTYTSTLTLTLISK